MKDAILIHPSLSHHTVPIYNMSDEISICFKCNNTFELKDSDKRPKVLDCLHSYCTGCCLLLAQEAEGNCIICPLCNISTQLDECGIPGLQDDFACIRLLDIKRKEELKNVKLSCENCDSNISVWKCLQCDESCSLLCEECKVQHGQLKALRSHELVPMDEFISSKVRTQDNFMCPKHPTELLEVYCCECRAAICLTCAVYEHHEHTRRTIEDGITVESEDISKRVEAVKQTYDTFEAETDSIDDIKQQLEHQHRTMSESLHNTFDSLHHALRERENELKHALDRLYNIKDRKLHNQISSLRKDIHNARLSVKYADSTLAHASPLQTLVVGEEIRNHMEVLLSAQLDTIPHTLPDLLFEGATLATVQNLVPNIGVIRDHSTPHPSRCELSQTALDLTPQLTWHCIFKLTMRNYSGELITRGAGGRPQVSVQLCDVSSQGDSNGPIKLLPFSMSFREGVWTVEVMSSCITGMLVEALVDGEHVEFSPLMATRGPEITLWGEDAGGILKASASHLSGLTSSYGPDNLRTGNRETKWKTSKQASAGSDVNDESVELGLVDKCCLISHINLVNRKAESYRLFYRPSRGDQEWLPFTATPTWVEIAKDLAWTIRLTEDECRAIGPVSAVRLELKSSSTGSSFCLINIFGWKLWGNI